MKELIHVISAVEITKKVYMFIDILSQKTETLALYLKEIEAKQGEKK